MTKKKEEKEEIKETTKLVCQEAFRLEIDGLSLDIPRGTVITCEGTATKIFDFTISNPKLITKLNEARKAKWLQPTNMA